MSAAAVPAVPDDARMSLIEHLAELRDRLIKVAVAVVDRDADRVRPLQPDLRVPPRPLRGHRQRSTEATLGDGRLLLSDPLEGFAIRMKLALYGGIAIAMPVILWQIWRFVTPGLYDHEKQYAVPFMVSALRLFVLGAGLAYYTLPRALDFLIDIGGEDNFVTAFQPDKYFTLITLHDAGLRDRLRVPDPADLPADGRGHHPAAAQRRSALRHRGDLRAGGRRSPRPATRSAC